MKLVIYKKMEGGPSLFIVTNFIVILFLHPTSNLIALENLTSALESDQTNE